MSSPAPGRSPDQIRNSIEETRRELAFSVNDLRSKVDEITDWRRLLAENRDVAMASAAVLGFVVGGGVGAAIGLVKRRPKA